jgi:hypothetical protein
MNQAAILFPEAFCILFNEAVINSKCLPSNDDLDDDNEVEKKVKQVQLLFPSHKIIYIYIYKVV